MSEMDKYYQILGLNPGTSEEEIKQAYKDLVNVWHPDRFLNNPRLREKANEKLKEINEAYNKLKSYIAGNPRYASSEDYGKSQPPPHEPPPKPEREQFSTAQDSGYGRPEPPPNEPPLKADQANAIWNPNATANWSLPFTPAFGSYLQMLNWRTLNEPAKASSAQSWFYASLLLLFIYFLIGMFVSDAEGRLNIIWWLSFLYLITWYIVAGRSQVKYVKAKFGKNYPKKPWGQALLIAVGALICCWVVAFAVNFIFRAVTTKDNINTASVPHSLSSSEEEPSSTQPPPETGLTPMDWYNTGHSFQSSGNYRAAIDAYSRAIALDPKLTAAYDSRGFSHYKLGELQEAIKDLDKVIEARPGDAKMYRIRGNLHFDLGNIRESVKDMEMAAQLEPQALNQPQPPSDISPASKSEAKRKEELPDSREKVPKPKLLVTINKVRIYTGGYYCSMEVRGTIENSGNIPIPNPEIILNIDDKTNEGFRIQDSIWPIADPPGSDLPPGIARSFAHTSVPVPEEQNIKYHISVKDYPFEVKYPNERRN